MAGSTKAGPSKGAGDNWATARMPGPLGRSDHGDPKMCSLLGDTPRTLGLSDWGDPALPIFEHEEMCVFRPLARTKDGSALPSPPGQVEKEYVATVKNGHR